MDEVTLTEIARVIRISAVKYADLSKTVPAITSLALSKCSASKAILALPAVRLHPCCGHLRRVTDLDLSQAKIVRSVKKEKDLGNKLAQFADPQPRCR